MASNHPTLAMLLVRHAMPVRPRAGESSDVDRELSAEGIEQAKKLALTYADAGIAAIYSSPLRRAMRTVEPLASRLGIEIERVEDLRERVPGAQTLEPGDWLLHHRKSWRDFDYAPADGESSRAAQRRVVAAIESIRLRHGSGTLMVVSHGNVIALALNAIDPGFGFDSWLQMPMAAVYRLEAIGGSWRIG
jgi:2,3-bisphosphoglycerate-dependent phosphoglycerate mutase